MPAGNLALEAVGEVQGEGSTGSYSRGGGGGGAAARAAQRLALCKWLGSMTRCKVFCN